MINIGDRIRLKCGEAPCECINKHDDGTISARYYKSGWVIRRDERDFIVLKHTENPGIPFRKENKMALYQVIGQEIYGELLVKNSQGKLVLELKGSNEVKAYLPSEVEEVRPYVITVYDGKKHENVEAPKDAFKVGDIYLNGALQLFRVTAIEVKQPASRRLNSWNKIQTQFFKHDEDNEYPANMNVENQCLI